ncbi:hypothetical protein FO519_007148 [Halicephalobus sp. NKZ332]|nr:hypothetical protein FO519_007148 [Halicephalobus sp. NKZ332]
MAANSEHTPVDIVEYHNKIRNLKPVNGLTKRVDGDVFDEWKRLDVYCFTVGFLVESLRTNDEEYKKNHGNRPIKDVEIYNISKGKGFSARILRGIVVFVDSTSESDTYTTILKMPGTEAFEELTAEIGSSHVLSEEDVQTFAFFHKAEAEFYNLLASSLGIPYPKIYKVLPWTPTENQGIIHMEDITGKGVTTGFYPPVSMGQITEAVRYLAHMHKTVLTGDGNHQKLWKEKYNKNQLAFTSYAPITAEYDDFLKICKDRDYFEVVLGKYKKFGGSSEYIEYAYSRSWRDLNLEPVLVHGDFWGGNIMWKLDKNNEVTNEIVAFVDWQIMHEGSPMADLARLLANSAEGDVRRQAEEFIIDFYHDLLEKEMKEVGKPCPYTVDQLKEAYNYMFLTQVYGLVVFAKMSKDLFKSDTLRLREAKMDTMFLRCRHALEDLDRILSGSLKHVFERFGQ